MYFRRECSEVVPVNNIQLDISTDDLDADAKAT